MGDLNVGDGVLKKGARDVVECLRPTEGFDLETPAGKSGSFGDAGAGSSFVRFCGTWQVAGQALSGSTAGHAKGLLSGHAAFKGADETVRELLNGIQVNHRDN